jgi:MFS family permease
VNSRVNHRPLWPTYAAESLESIGTTLLSVSIFFWTAKHLGFSLKQNFLLAMGQGIVYTAGALLAERLAGRFGRRRALIGIYVILVFVSLAAALAPRQELVIVLLLAYSFVAAANWPMLESLVSSDAPDAHALSKRVGVYNLMWSGSNTIAIALSGMLIDSARSGIFLVAALANVIATIIIALQPGIDPHGAATVPSAHADPEPELLASRTLAMWLARIALPATYVVVYAMSAMFPSLPVMRNLTTAQSTLVSSAWMASRFITFLVLGYTVWWHTRPKLLLGSSFVMLVAFLGVTIPPSAWVEAGYTIDLVSMLSWQLVLGIAMGIIYSGSLYFGMVLSQGSTEHGGYHEALIGLGSVLGPGAGAFTQSFAATATGRTPFVAIAAVSGVIAITIAAACAATVRAGRR